MAETINRFVGAETGGLQESSFIGSLWSVSATNSVMLTKGQYCYKVTGDGQAGTAHYLQFKAFEYEATAYAGIMWSFDIVFLAWPTSAVLFAQALENDSSIDIKLGVNASGGINLLDSNNSPLDSISGLSLNTKYRFIVYWENAASADWEWWLSTSGGTPASQGSGTGADLIASGDGFDSVRFECPHNNQSYVLDNIVIMSGCTSTSDHLGAPVDVLALATLTGTEAGDALDAGSMDNTQYIPMTTGSATYNAGATARSRWIESNSARYVYTSSTGGTSPFWFDASDEGPNDPDTVWTDPANAFNGLVASYALTTTTGSETTNELSGGGVNVPTGLPDSLLSAAYGTIYVLSNDGSLVSASAAFYTNGKGEYLGTSTAGTTSTTIATGGNNVALSPTGGLTWDILAGLEVYIYATNVGTSGVRVLRVPLSYLYYNARTPSEYGATNTIAAKLLMDAIV